MAAKEVKLWLTESAQKVLDTLPKDSDVTWVRHGTEIMEVLVVMSVHRGMNFTGFLFLCRSTLGLMLAQGASS